MKTAGLDKATLTVAAALAALALGVAIRGPVGPIPMHFDLSGQVDRWGDRRELAWTLGGLGLLTLLVAGGLGIAAGMLADDLTSRRRGLRVGQGVILIVFAGVAGLISMLTLGGLGAEAMPGLMMGGLGLIIASAGAALGRVAPNPFVGVRTPWSYKSRLAWDRSNRLLGRLWFFGGLIALLAAPVASQPAGVTTLIVGVVATALLAAAESWRVWRLDPDRQPF